MPGINSSGSAKTRPLKITTITTESKTTIVAEVGAGRKIISKIRIFQKAIRRRRMGAILICSQTRRKFPWCQLGRNRLAIRRQ